MNRSVALLLSAAVTLVPAAVLAAPLSMWLGQTKCLNHSGQAREVHVSNPEVVSVRAGETCLGLLGVSPGVTQVRMTMQGGETYEVAVHVTERGADVYSLDRSELEHASPRLEPKASGRRVARTRGAVKEAPAVRRDRAVERVSRPERSRPARAVAPAPAAETSRKRRQTARRIEVREVRAALSQGLARATVAQLPLELE